MKHINYLIFEGRLTKDAILEPSGQLQVCHFTVANNYSWTSENEKDEKEMF